MKKADQKIKQTTPDLTDKLARIAHEPGVYLLKDEDGTIIYIGKARDLRTSNSLRSKWF